jgi:hypothetical protein
MILPRALPVMSGTRHSTSVMRRSLSQRRSEFSLFSWSPTLAADLPAALSAALSVGLLRFGSFLCHDHQLRCVARSRHAVAEGLKNAEIERVVAYLPLGMPLHGEHEWVRAVETDRLDQSIWRTRFDHTAWRERPHALAVQRIDHDRMGTGDAMQHAAVSQVYGVGKSVLDVERIVRSRDDPLKPGCSCTFWYRVPPKRDVDFLESTAHRQHRHAHLDGERASAADWWHRVPDHAGCLRSWFVAVVMRFDVAVSAGQQQAIKRAQHDTQVKRRVQRGISTGRRSHHRPRAHVLLADGEEAGAAPICLSVGGQPDERNRGHAGASCEHRRTLPGRFIFTTG